MSFELPANLQQTADILRMSLMARGDEKAPALPAGLLADLTARFATKHSIPVQVARVSLFAKIQSFVSAPAFGMAAVALVIVAVAFPSVFKTTDSTSFRGGSVEATASASIVLIGAPQDIVSSLGNSGDFEKGSILTTDTASGSKVIVDFNTSAISSISADGETVFTTALPVDRSELSTAIAEALSKF